MLTVVPLRHHSGAGTRGSSRPPADRLPHHLSPAPRRTGLAVFLEDPQMVLVVPRPAQHVEVEPHRRPPVLDARREVLLDRLVERPPLLVRERVRLAAGMQPRVVEDLVRVDVAHPGDHLLIQQQGLYLGSARTEPVAQVRRRKVLPERLRTQRREPLLELLLPQQTRPGEPGLVPQEQPSISVQMEDEQQRRPWLLHRRHEEELPTYLELEDERVSGVQLHDEVLCPPPRPRDPAAPEPAGELLGRRLLDERGIEHLGALDRRAHDELAQVLFYGLYLGELRHGVVIPRPGVSTPVAASGRLARLERRVALPQRIVAVGVQRPYPEAHIAELGGHLRRVVQPHAVYLVVAPVVLPHLPEADDPARHRPLLRVLLPLGEHRPIVPHAEAPRRGAGRHLPRAQDVEDEDAAGDQSLEDAPEERPQTAGLLVEQVVEDLADSRDGAAQWDLGIEKRPDPKLGLRHPPP